MDDVKKATEYISTTLKESLAKQFVGKKTTPLIKEEIAIGVQTILAKMNANLLGYEVVKVEIMWKSWSLAKKAKWIWFNKITGKGKAIRDHIDAVNEAAYLEAIKDLTDDEDPDDYHYDRIQYPWYAVSSPKGQVVVDTIIRPTQPLEFISLSAQLK